MSIEYRPYELHTHTQHSDGRFTTEELAKNAAECGLAGFALTDHNTSTGVPYAADAAEKRGLVFLPGIEWTTFFGHCTVLGGDFGIDWRTVNPFMVSEKAAEVGHMGGCAGIAHPYRIGYPICTGGSDEWKLNDRYGSFTHYEIWSYKDPSAEPTNANAEARFRALTEAGNRLACVYGKDWHGPEAGLFAATFVGTEGAPTAEKVLGAIKKRRTYVSLGVTLGASLSDKAGNVYGLGDEMPAGEYILDAKVEAPRGMFSAGNRFRADALTLYSAGGKKETAALCDGRCVIPIKLSKGYLQIAAEGEINGLPRRLLIASPFYIDSSKEAW